MGARSVESRVERGDPETNGFQSSKEGGERCCSSSLPPRYNFYSSSPKAAPIAPNAAPRYSSNCLLTVCGNKNTLKNSATAECVVKRRMMDFVSV